MFALVILCGEVPSGLLSDMWGRKKTLLLGSALKVELSLLPQLAAVGVLPIIAYFGMASFFGWRGIFPSVLSALEIVFSIAL